MEKLTKCVTQSAAETLKLCSLQRDNPRLKVQIGELECNSILALELYYHRPCYLEFIRPNRVSGRMMKLSQTCNELFFSEIKKKVIEDFEVLPVTELSDIYIQISGENHETPTLIDLVKKHFKDQIASWVPKTGPQFIFNDEVDKGYIIEVLVKQINNFKSKQESTDEQIKTVGSMIRNDIKEVSPALI